MKKQWLMAAALWWCGAVWAGSVDDSLQQAQALYDQGKYEQAFVAFQKAAAQGDVKAKNRLDGLAP